jgi:16S rRNA (guanine966-N2)-methyltransferase
MSVLAPRLEGAEVLDLFAGSGALGLEALSRGARRVTFVERGRRTLKCLRDNIAALDAGGLATVVVGDVFSYVKGLEPGAYDIAFADPPYAQGLASRLVDRYLEAPFSRILAVEHDPGEVLAVPPGTDVRRYGDTMITFLELTSDIG